MSNKGKDIDVKSRRYYFSNYIIDIKIFNPNNIKNENHTKIFLFTTLDI